MTNKNKGILLIILSAFCFAIMNAFVQLSGDLPAIQKSFFRNLVAAIFTIIIMRKELVKFHIEKKNVLMLILRSSFGTIGILCHYYALNNLMISDASMLNKLSPFFVIIFSYFFLKEKVSFVQGISVIVAFIGSLFIIKPTFLNADLGASLIGVLGGLAAGVAYTTIRYLGQRGVNKAVIVFAFSSFSCMVTFPFILFDYHTMSFTQLILLLLAGFAALGGQITITSAYTYAPAREISVYDYSQVVFSAILGFILFTQIADYYSIFGYIIICGIAVFSFLKREKQ
jgi:drug/metabolite transporter (DMT)-like permease